jgi:hypothetical protein
MSVSISSVFGISCVGSGLATGLIHRPRSPIKCLQDPDLQINSDGKEARKPNTSRHNNNNNNFGGYAILLSIFKESSVIEIYSLM